MANPRGIGGFKKGGPSPNPGGRPRAIASLQLAARAHMHSALKTLITIAKAGKSEASHVAAATAILDRAFGKPIQSVEMTMDTNMIQAKLNELSDAELATLEARLQAFGTQADLFDGDGFARPN
jgi:hypothetical protein